MNTDKKILDACCGGRMFWFNKQHPNAIYMDIREHNAGDNKWRPNFTVHPDIIGDFREIPFPEKSFKLVIFDPPHIFNASKGSVIGDYYGYLNEETWEQDLSKGFNECWRVLDDYGTLIFKWAEISKTKTKVLSLFPVEPLFGHRPGGRTKGHWYCFMKVPTFKQELLGESKE